LSVAQVKEFKSMVAKKKAAKKKGTKKKAAKKKNGGGSGTFRRPLPPASPAAPGSRTTDPGPKMAQDEDESDEP
jgi:hypothetical protein